MDSFLKIGLCFVFFIVEHDVEGTERRTTATWRGWALRALRSELVEMRKIVVQSLTDDLEVAVKFPNVVGYLRDPNGWLDTKQVEWVSKQRNKEASK